LELIDAELKLLSNAEGIKSVLDKVQDELQEGDNPIVQHLKSLINQLSVYSSYHTELPGLLERLQAAQVELNDIASELNHISDHIHYDPQRIEQLSERLSQGYKLQKKHGVSTTNELLFIQQQLEEKLQAVLDIDHAIAQKEKE